MNNISVSVIARIS